MGPAWVDSRPCRLFKGPPWAGMRRLRTVPAPIGALAPTSATGRGLLRVQVPKDSELGDPAKLEDADHFSAALVEHARRCFVGFAHLDGILPAGHARQRLSTSDSDAEPPRHARRHDGAAHQAGDPGAALQTPLAVARTGDTGRMRVTQGVCSYRCRRLSLTGGSALWDPGLCDRKHITVA